MSVPYPSDIMKQAQATLEGWKKIEPPATFGALTPAAFGTELDKAQPLLAQVDALEAQLTDLRNQRDALYTGLWDKAKRVRSAVKGIYGDDSSEYEMVGGTRQSERKHPVR